VGFLVEVAQDVVAGYALTEGFGFWVDELDDPRCDFFVPFLGADFGGAGDAVVACGSACYCCRGARCPGERAGLGCEVLVVLLWCWEVTGESLAVC
jgi:hypothetical protein